MFRDIVSAYPPETRKQILSDLGEHLTDEERIEAFVLFGATLGLEEQRVRKIVAQGIKKLEG
jgi:hypothetical protein